MIMLEGDSGDDKHDLQTLIRSISGSGFSGNSTDSLRNSLFTSLIHSSKPPSSFSTLSDISSAPENS